MSEANEVSMLTRIAIAISGEDQAGWDALPDDDEERLYGGGKWSDSGHTKADYVDDARAALEALLEPTEGMIKAGLYQSFRNMPLLDQWKTMIRAALQQS